jgi:TPR repeat protein
MDDQIPWYESSLTEKYYFQPPEGITVVPGKSPQVASIVKDTAVRRGDTVHEAAPENAWFRQLTAAEWSNIDWEIQQRVKHLTPDEIPALEHKAKGGNVLAQTTLGLAYREGVERATDQGSGKVMRFKSNNSQALRWLRKAAETGFPVAQTELGEMYYGGRGVDRNLDEARRWLELAAAASYPRARLDLLQLKVLMDPREWKAEVETSELIDLVKLLGGGSRK